MKIYTLPEKVHCLIFDMDATLYTHHEYAEAQNILLVEYLAQQKGTDYGSMREKVESYRTEWAASHGGKKLSMGNAMKAFGISIKESIRIREALIDPSTYLHSDPTLRGALQELHETMALAIVTNNPILVASKTLKVLGVDDLFSSIIGLDTFGVSKPHAPSFLKAASDTGTPVQHCVAVGDRYDIDIALPLELGMGGILVTGAEDVYQLPGLINRDKT